MQVAQIIDTLFWGGVQELQVTLATAARSSDVDLTLISLRADDGTPYLNRLRALDVPTFLFPAKRTLDPRRIWNLSRFLRSRSFDLVHAHLPTANIVGTAAGRLAGLPVIGALHLSSDGPHPPRRRRLEAWALRHGARCVTACGSAVADAHRERLRDLPVHVVPNAVASGVTLSSAERFQLRQELVGDTDVPILVTVGRLSPEKGLEDLLVAAARLRAARTPFRLLIVGDGELRSTLRERIEALGLIDEVALLGARDDVPRLLVACDLFVNAATGEGLSIAILEAMSAALPVVATDVGDSSRVLSDGAGAVVPPGDAVHLATTLRAFLEDPHRRQACGAAARRHVERHYGIEAWFETLCSLYSAVLTEGQTHRMD